MSKAVICDECGNLCKESDTLRCADATVSCGSFVYSAHLCKSCQGKFNLRNDIYGWHAIAKKEGDEK